MNKVKEFFRYKDNKYINIGLIISLFIIFSYKITENMEEVITGADFCYNFLSQVSLAYVASFVFYVLQVYIPNKRKQDKIVLCIEKPMQLVRTNMEKQIQYFRDKWTNDISLDDMNEDDYVEMCKKVNPYEKAAMELQNDKIANNIEYIIVQIDRVETYSKKVLDHYMYVDTELIIIINKILNSQYHLQFKELYKFGRDNTDISHLSKQVKEYNELLVELKEYCKKEKISD